MSEYHCYYFGSSEVQVSFLERVLTVTAVVRDGTEFRSVALLEIHPLPFGMAQRFGVSVLYSPAKVVLATAQVDSTDFSGSGKE